MDSVDCPVPGCDVSGERDEVFVHFTSHRVFEQKHPLLNFVLDRDNWREYETSKSDGPFSKRSEYISAIQDALEDHPILEEDMYIGYFGSIEEAIDTAKTTVGETNYSPDDPIWESIIRKELFELSRYDKEKYGPNWPEKRRSTLERDDLTCRVCEKEYYTDTSRIQVHHITPARSFHADSSGGDPDYQMMNDLSNLVTLCASCHGTFGGKWKDTNHHEFVENAKKERLEQTTS